MLENAREASPLCYDPAMDEAMPEVAQRYFARAITRSTPLHRVVNLETAGSSIMIRAKMPMSERLILTRLGRDIVWHGVVGSRLMHFVRLGGCRAPGCHAPEGGTVESGTMFWPRGVIPLARTGGTADHARDLSRGWPRASQCPDRRSSSRSGLRPAAARCPLTAAR